MSMPPRDLGHVPAFNVPRSVLAALAAIGLVHLYRAFLTVEADLDFLLRLAFIPARYSGSPVEIPGGDIAAWTSPFTYMFVHGDLTHLLVNGVWMLAFGSAIAKRIGGLRFVIFSLLSGIAGAVAHFALHSGELVPVVGASAAISGQMAGALRALFSAGPRVLTDMRSDLSHIPLASIGDTLKNPRLLAFLALWVGLNALFGLGYVQLEGMEDAIAWEAHLGGFLCGLLTIGLFDRGATHRPQAPTFH